ncbi:hypothetical protein R3P38DRAFT_3206339 [Favolaschia claudopus]|uniref:Uncharacterized protein n=1 Tax=Favolaschia claudopus TaxID=2862362 RepID=A0AAW0ALH4_9AGAR
MPPAQKANPQTEVRSPIAVLVAGLAAFTLSPSILRHAEPHSPSASEHAFASLDACYVVYRPHVHLNPRYLLHLQPIIDLDIPPSLLTMSSSLPWPAPSPSILDYSFPFSMLSATYCAAALLLMHLCPRRRFRYLPDFMPSHHVLVPLFAIDPIHLTYTLPPVPPATDPMSSTSLYRTLTLPIRPATPLR